jgi:hypothetical protein
VSFPHFFSQLSTGEDPLHASDEILFASGVANNGSSTSGVPLTLVSTIIISFFVERRSTKERYCQPPPQFGNNCQQHARLPAPARAPVRATFLEQFLHTVVRAMLQLHNCSFFTLCSTTEQMPALLKLFCANFSFFTKHEQCVLSQLNTTALLPRFP